MIRPGREIVRGCQALCAAGSLLLALAGASGAALAPDSTNAEPLRAATPPDPSEPFQTRLELARHYRHVRQPREAEPLLVELLGDTAPELIRQQALLEMALAARDEDELPRAQQIYAQFLNRWPDAVLVPEVLLRQGQLFRQMGLNNLALAKFYAVMTSALVLKSDMLDYYQHLVLLAQTEIAESHFQLGKYAEAAEFFSRLLKQQHSDLDRSWAQCRLVRSLAELGRHDETVAQAQDYLSRFSSTPERPEVRFHLALALTQLGRHDEALQQVLRLLQEQQALTKEHPELWAYWQQRAGNEIGNQLYHEGDYARALEIYVNLAPLDPEPAWQLPVEYQIGLTYERLAQPQKAVQTYTELLKHQPELGTNASPGLTAIFDMARWRASFVQWQSKAESSNRGFSLSQPAGAAEAPKHP